MFEGIKRADIFFDYAKKRYQLMMDKEGGFPPPWTEDEVLNSYRFCNIFREDDKVTKWFRENIREPLRDDPKVLQATLIFRWFNKISTGSILHHEGLLTNWDSDKVRKVLKDEKPLVTGAYMIKTPAKMSKLEGLIWCIEQFLQQDPANLNPPPVYGPMLFQQEGYTLENAVKYLSSFPYLGPFMAYEIVTDLRHTALLENAPDIMTWANPGPGAARGLARLCDLPLGYFNRHSQKDVDQMQVLMQELLSMANKKGNIHWPDRWPQWEMREVEHTLCEVDKYLRAQTGEGTPKQKYTPQ